MIGQVLLWYAFITMLGFITLPITRKIFSKLPDQGYAFSRIVAIFLWGYAYWLLASFGIIQNNLSSAWSILILLCIVSVIFFFKSGHLEYIQYFKNQKKSIIVSEILFIVAFALLALIRATMPEISGTEKPMELAFINSILQSGQFPPRDPWLSGYAISYYYFGYVIISLIIRVTGVASGIAFNLSAALWFAMTAVASYGMLLNLLKLFQKRTGHSLKSHMASILAPIFVLIVSNMEGFLEVLHARGVFWSKTADGTLVSPFWEWLGILELNQPPSQPFTWMPSRPGGVLWWRASRVISDVNLSGQRFEVIDEFPFFSYLLADLHPHVLTMPFAILAIAIAMNILLIIQSDHDPFIIHWLRRQEFWIAALILGGLSFFNTWDFPIYVALTAAIFAFGVYKRIGWGKQVFFQLVLSGLLLGIAGVALYLPFYLGFSSQAGGILPSMSFFTRGIIFWVMFSPLLVPIFFWLLQKTRSIQKKQWLNGFKISAVIVFGLGILFFIWGAILLSLPVILYSTLVQNIPLPLVDRMVNASNQLAGLHGLSSAGQILIESLIVRLQSPGTWLTLFILIVLIWALLGSKKVVSKRESESESESERSIDPPELFNADEVFVALVIFLGVGLTLFPEFGYLRDQFGTRMNTIFKFYFQTWILWGFAAAYATVIIFQQKNRARILFRVIVIFFMVSGLFYPLIMTWQKSNGFKPYIWTLDGNYFRKTYETSELNAAQWLGQADYGVIAEAIGGSYSGYARMATLSGLPNVLGWVGHELQWRGGVLEMGNRESDIRHLYETNQWEDALSIIQQYDIRYIVLGGLEQRTYNVHPEKFDDYLPKIFENQDVIIYDALLLLDH